MSARHRRNGLGEGPAGGWRAIDIREVYCVCVCVQSAVRCNIMRTMKGRRFTRFEALAQRLVEDTFSRVFGEHSISREVAMALARAVEDGAHGRRGEQAPARYRLRLHGEDYARLEAQWDDLAPRLSGYITDVAEQAGLYLAGAPVVELAVEDTARLGAVRVEVLRTSSAAGTTQTYSAPVSPADDDIEGRLRALDAFLIVNGRRHVPLDRALVTIGRRVDNDVIIDSPVVSRQHAHVRWRHGRFVLYDVGSRGGVAVNGERCQECVLQPGDLITLANRVSIIYGEGLESRDSLPASTANREQETLTFPADDDG